MSSPVSERAKLVLATAGFLVLAGCVVDAGDGGGAYYSGNAYPGYYEPYGAYYGGWQPGYYVAPYNNRTYRHNGAVSHRAAIPSIPSAARMNAAHISGGAHLSGGAHPRGGSSRGR